MRLLPTTASLGQPHVAILQSLNGAMMATWLDQGFQKLTANKLFISMPQLFDVASAFGQFQAKMELSRLRNNPFFRTVRGIKHHQGWGILGFESCCTRDDAEAWVLRGSHNCQLAGFRKARQAGSMNLINKGFAGEHGTCSQLPARAAGFA
eukprot:756424-Pelagomonas_calceolata.AAC.2